MQMCEQILKKAPNTIQIPWIAKNQYRSAQLTAIKRQQPNTVQNLWIKKTEKANYVLCYGFAAIKKNILINYQNAQEQILYFCTKTQDYNKYLKFCLRAIQNWINLGSLSITIFAVNFRQVHQAELYSIWE